MGTALVAVFTFFFVGLVIVMAVRDLRQKEQSIIRWGWRWLLELIGVIPGQVAFRTLASLHHVAQRPA